MITGGESRIFVNGVDVQARFNLLFTDESELNPPEKVTNYKDIPGMDGVLDLSEVLTEDINFGPRLQTIVFFVPDDQDFEKTKTALSNFLDGRRFDYTFSFDPGYTYNGRFRVTEYSGWRNHRIAVEIDADPWKRGEHKRYVVQGAGGVPVYLENGRRHTKIWITVKNPTEVVYEDRVWILPEAGTWNIEDLRLLEGTSVIRLNTAPEMCDTSWDDLARLYSRWDDIPNGSRWSDFFFTKSETPSSTWNAITKMYARWNDLPANMTWNDLSSLTGQAPTGNDYEAVIEYDIYDL